MYDVITPVNFVPGENESVFGYLDENSKRLKIKWHGIMQRNLYQFYWLEVDYKQRHSLEFK